MQRYLHVPSAAEALDSLVDFNVFTKLLLCSMGEVGDNHSLAKVGDRSPANVNMPAASLTVFTGQAATCSNMKNYYGKSLNQIRPSAKISLQVQ